ncbi:hypothetical protein V6Z12_A09G135300 [Gossypium hirsutum]
MGLFYLVVFFYSKCMSNLIAFSMQEHSMVGTIILGTIFFFFGKQLWKVDRIRGLFYFWDVM